eukprot:1874467-Rhodomonas_salina.1
MQGSVNASMTPRSSGAVLSTATALVSTDAPEELQPGDGQDAAASMERASLLAADKPDFSDEDLIDAIALCNGVLFASRMEEEPPRRDQVVQGVVRALRHVTAAYAKQMLSQESPLSVSTETLQLDVRREGGASAAEADANATLALETDIADNGFVSAELAVP